MTPMNVRISPETQKRFALAAKRISWKESATIRLCMEIGLDHLESINKSPADLFREEAARVREAKKGA